MDDADHEEVALWDINIPTLNLFMCCKTQLRTSFGGVVGLDYTAVKAVADGLNIKMTPDMWAGVQVCEDEMLARYNKGSG